MDEAISEEEMVKALKEFFAHKGTTPQTITYLMRFIQDRPARASPDPIIPMDEIETRLELLRKIRELAAVLFKNFQFTHLQLAYFLLMPLSLLRELSEGNPKALPAYLNIRYLGPGLAFMVGESVPGGKPFEKIAAERTGMPLQDNDIRKIKLKTDAKQVEPNAAEKKKCLIRDRRACILTRAAFPEACHIVPFTANSSNANIQYYFRISQNLFAIIGSSVWAQLKELIQAGPGFCDQSWNMISLNPTLHDWWKRCLFGIKCHGVVPVDRGTSVVRLQFHWMPRNKVNPKEHAELTADTIQKMMQTVPEQNWSIIEEYGRCSGRPLETGYTFNVVLGRQEAERMKVMIDVQWAVVTLAATSGLARTWEALNIAAGAGNRAESGQAKS
ncbi:hypothetical protein ACHAQJ_001146 [Trichoderma viride]